ncbi:hypothetical protein LTR17_024840 [Elasticomyces elasticus]|nr:hypothetical protein LTR17_024840 [Elasticomyces elasticus]
MTGRSKAPAAYITGGASGIGSAAAALLVHKGYRVYSADANFTGAKAQADKLNNPSPETEPAAWAGEVDVSDWNSQRAAFEDALNRLGPIDLVLPIAGIGERKWLDRPSKAEGFVKPDLAVQSIDETGVVYTVALAVQHFHWAKEDDPCFEGRILTVASVCGFYIQPTTPIYTLAKHGVVGFVRSFGTYLQDQGIKLNAICPSRVRTNITVKGIHDLAEERGLLVPMPQLHKSFEAFLPGGEHSALSGQCLEVAPREMRLVPTIEFFNDDQRRSVAMAAEVQRGTL